MDIFHFFELLGGLALFLFGMSLMGESLEKRAGQRLKPVLAQLTNHPLKGVLLGALVTALIQSSSATTVMIVGFVNTGIMTLHQAIYVVMGANVGTTATSWLLSLSGIESNNFWISLLKPANLSPILAFIGMVIFFLHRRHRDTAGILIGFSILMFGMEQMSSSVKGLAKVPEFVNLLTAFSNPIIGVAMGALVTACIQSSSASVGILQALANTGSLQYTSALPIIMGQNIGTCVTALLASIGVNRDAKRVAFIHLYFNIIGTAIFLTLYYALDAILHFSFAHHTVTAFGIALTHSVFNLFTTAALMPFARSLEKLAIRTIPSTKEEESFALLDKRFLNAPAVAIQQARRVTEDMGRIARESFDLALSLLDHFDEKKADRVFELEDKVDQYEDKIGSYLVEVSTMSLTDHDSREVSLMLHTIGDLERISDHAQNVAQSAAEIYEKGLKFSDPAQRELAVIRSAVEEILMLSTDAFINNDLKTAERVEPLEEVVDQLRAEIKVNHVHRLRTGECTIELGFVLSDILTNLERCSDHCSNVAAGLIEMERLGRLDAHEYVKNLKEGPASINFNTLYEAYSEKYQLPLAEAPGKAAETKVEPA